MTPSELEGRVLLTSLYTVKQEEIGLGLLSPTLKGLLYQTHLQREVLTFKLALKQYSNNKEAPTPG